MEGYAVAMNVFADNPLACYYGEGATTSSDSSGVIPPEDNFEYQTIGQRVSSLVANKAAKERESIASLYSAAPTLSRQEVSRLNQAWNGGTWVTIPLP